MYPPLSSRSEATGKHISIGITLACRSVIAAGLALGLLIGAANLLPMRSALGMTAFGLLTFVGSMVLHEFTHLLVIKQEIATVDILRRGLRIGLIHRETTNMIAIASSLAGPAAGMAYCGCLALAAHLLQAPLCSILALIAASFHLWALLPWFGDGSCFLMNSHAAIYENHRFVSDSLRPPQVMSCRNDTCTTGGFLFNDVFGSHNS